jgi:hypothetical protein
MKRYLIPIIILSFCACSNPHKRENKQTILQEPDKADTLTKTEPIKKNTEEIRFTKSNGEAVLIGEKIELLDNDLKAIADISNFAGKIVSIKGVSDSLFNQGKGYEGFCKSFWYVQIQSDTIKGIVNGRQVFKILDLKQGENFIFNGNNIELLRTEFFGMGVDYQGDLMGCPVDQPVILKDTANNYYGLVDLVQNEYSKEASWGTSYPYFELRADDGGHDKIDTFLVEENKIRLRIHRGFQEGENDSDVLLSFDNDKYIAEYLNFGEIKYE